MGKKKATPPRSGAFAMFAATLKGIVMNMALTTASCAIVYAVLAAARALA